MSLYLVLKQLVILYFQVDGFEFCIFGLTYLRFLCFLATELRHLLQSL